MSDSFTLDITLTPEGSEPVGVAIEVSYPADMGLYAVRGLETMVANPDMFIAAMLNDHDASILEALEGQPEQAEYAGTDVGGKFTLAAKFETDEGVVIPVDFTVTYPRGKGIFVAQSLRAVPERINGIYTSLISSNDNSVINALMKSRS